MLFWVAFVFTWPFGAAFGDFLTKPAAGWDLEFGTLTASLVTLALTLAVLGAQVAATKRTRVASG